MPYRIPTESESARTMLFFNKVLFGTVDAAGSDCFPLEREVEPTAHPCQVKKCELLDTNECDYCGGFFCGDHSEPMSGVQCALGHACPAFDEGEDPNE
jgi:hypothetical protein